MNNTHARKIAFRTGSAFRLTKIEQQQLDSKISFETSKSFHSMVKLGAFSNILGAFFYVLAIYDTKNARAILIWYGVLFLANLINVFWALRFEYKDITVQEMRTCRQGFLYLVIIICLIWGSIGILIMSQGIQQQITTIIFLSAVLICFSFSTTIDLTMGIVSILCLVMPSILYHIYLTVFFFHNLSDINLHLSISAAFIMLGLFMLIACFIGNKVVLKVFRLGYENALLSEKLENMNALLEERVKERTKELENSLQLVTYQATHDLLTTLPNERLLQEHMQLITKDAIKNSHKFALVCFSLNGMEKINDGVGHRAATKITQLVARRFAKVFAKKIKYFISLARQEIFVIIINPITDNVEVAAYVDDLFVILNQPFRVAKKSLQLTGSAGVSIFPTHGQDVDTLITNAKAARVLAVHRGGNSVRIYNTDITADASRQLNIENLLYHAIKNNELLLNYQPFINIETGQICGMEALVRWRSPILGLISPLDFIPIAENNRMILPIGEWVLHNACKELKLWHKKGFDDLCMSVNLSAKQLEQKDLVERIAAILKTLPLDPRCLELELTEAELFQNDAILVFNQLTQMGISLAIDDFGTGYSDFCNLKLFQIDKIKIDKIFIQDIDASTESRNIVCNTIALTKSMNIKCLAEGVETPEQAQYLKEQGCTIMQGYYFSKPLSAEDFLFLLMNYQDSECYKRAQYFIR